MKIFTFNLLLIMRAFAEQQQVVSGAGLDAILGGSHEHKVSGAEQAAGKVSNPTMEYFDTLLSKEHADLKLLEKERAAAGSEGTKSKEQTAQNAREKQTIMMEERLRTTLKAKVRAMVEKIGEDERKMLKGEQIKEDVDHTAGEMTMPAMDERGGFPTKMVGDPHFDPDCALFFFHGLGHGRTDKKTEDVFFRTDSLRLTKPVSKKTKECKKGADGKYEAKCQEEYELLGEVDRCIILLPKAPVTKHSANGDSHAASWFNQPQLGTGADFKPPNHGIDFDEANRHTPKIHAMIDDLIDNYGIHPEKIFLSGFSQGATVAALAALSYPKSIGGLGMFSGQMIGKDNLIKMTHHENRDIPIMWGYTHDDDVFLTSLHDEGTALLSSNGFKVRSVRYPGLHYMTQRAFDNLNHLVAKKVTYVDFAERVRRGSPERFEELVPGFQF